MSVFYCHRCQQTQDRDYVGCVEDPTVRFGLMCPEHEAHCGQCDRVLLAGEDLVDSNDDPVCAECAERGNGC